MTPQPLPDTPTLIERVKVAMRDAHAEWDCDRRDRGRGKAKIATRALVRRVWELGFDHPRVYPIASVKNLGAGAECYARDHLQRRDASRWTWKPREEHSTIREPLYDVMWAEFGAEYKDESVPLFKRLVLALESEISGGEWEVLYDFNKLPAARAELRVMVWDRDKVEDGFDLLEPRLRKADGWKQGWWLLSGWGKDGFEHRVYHDEERKEDLERAPK